MKRSVHRRGPAYENPPAKSARVEEAEAGPHLRCSFPVHPISQFCGSFPTYKQPKELGSYSLDWDRQFHDDQRCRKVYTPPEPGKPVNFDLSEGYKAFVGKDEDEKHYLNPILTWITANRSQINGSRKLSETQVTSEDTLPYDVITWRGQLTRMMCTPYERRDPWAMVATLYNKTLYIAEIDTKESKERRENATERSKLMCYWGRRFEDYVSHFEGTEGKVKRPVNDMQAFCSVVSTKLEGVRILMSGEVDCYEKDGSSDYIELKTSRHIDRDRQNHSFLKFKIIRWWAQSFLIGVPKIICGWRDDDGFVKRLETFKTLELPRLVRDRESMWDPSVCLNFCHQLLVWIQSVITEDNPKIAYLIEWKSPFREVTVKVLPENSSYVFLPDWYTECKT
eukprot:m.18146 g.18146  ORF g.18146 m.18146 type:complete len:395 (+) comp27606_c0_seq2:157-1341(+)